jgi:hypothetical protein
LYLLIYSSLIGKRGFLMNRKRGQVTLFIVIGLILLIAASISIYLYSARESRLIEQVQLPTVQQVPAEAEPIREYVKSCIQETAKQGLKQLGEHGGYIDSSELMYNLFDPTEGEAVQFSKNSDLIIPYWWYMKSINTCVDNCRFDSKRPTTQEIKRQLEKYMNENLRRCLGTFSAFPSYKFYEKQNPNTKVTIGKQNLVFYVEHPIRVERGSVSFEIPDYAMSIDLNLKEIYDVATKLTELEQQYGYLERYTNQLISIFSRLDPEALPPKGALDIEIGGGTIWTEPQIKEKLTELLTSYIPLLQVPGTRNYRNREAPPGTKDPKLYRTLYNRNMAVLLDEKLEEAHPSLEVNFNYLDWWEPYIDVCPGQICQPETAMSSIPLIGALIGIQRYQFAYDVSFPVLIEINNPSAFKGEGYSFKFFIEHNMRANKPMTADYQRFEMLDISPNTMLCKKQHWLSENFTITVKDGRTRDLLDDVQIGIDCGGETCNIGTTANGELETKMPKCFGSIMIAQKPGYHKKYIPVETDATTEQTVNIVLEPYRFVDVNTMKWLIKKHGATKWEMDTEAPAHPEKDENTLIMLRRKTNDLEEPFMTTAEICGGLMKAKIPCGSPPRDNSKNIKILPGKYDVSISDIHSQT